MDKAKERDNISKHEKFIRAIQADADNDTPRLIYASWLDEQGDPRGEFIRVQCELAQMDPQQASPHREKLERRERELLKGRKSLWRKGLPKVKGIEYGPKFYRGFVDTVTAESWSKYSEHVAQIARHAPIRKITLKSYKGTDFSRMVGGDMYAALRSVELQRLQGYLEIGDFRALANSPLFSQLTHLQLESLPVGDQEAEVFVGSPNLSNVEMLVLQSLSDTTGAALAKSPHLARLKWLSLSYSELHQQFCEALPKAKFAEMLELLDVRDSYCDDRDFVHVIGGKFPKLETLWIDGSDLADGTLFALAKSKNWKQLRVISLAGRVSEKGLLAIMNSPNLPNLENIKMHGGRVDMSAETQKRWWNRDFGIHRYGMNSH